MSKYLWQTDSMMLCYTKKQWLLDSPLLKILMVSQKAN